MLACDLFVCQFVCSLISNPHLVVLCLVSPSRPALQTLLLVDGSAQDAAAYELARRLSEAGIRRMSGDLYIFFIIFTILLFLMGVLFFLNLNNVPKSY